jgi:Luciferase-like monooxygenase
LKIGTGVCLVNQRDPIQTAKLVASIDQVSGGRFLFGIGVGWNAEEMEDHGTVFTTRAKPEYAGEFVNFGPMMAWPKSLRHPPLPSRTSPAREKPPSMNEFDPAPAGARATE